MAGDVLTPVPPSTGSVAPVWHTLAVIGILLALSALGARSHNMSPVGQPAHRAIGYVTIMIFEWALTGFIAWGISRRGFHLRDLIAGRWNRWTSPLRDLGLAVVFLLVADPILGVVAFSLKAKATGATRNLFPRTPLEIALYVLVTITAGFCEELIFRGYLQRQLSSFTHSAAMGLILQAAVFGIAHGYQGVKFMFIITVFGAMFGLLALWRRSLRPGMAAHFLQDCVLGLIGGHFLK
jgi:hypothetical protein